MKLHKRHNWLVALIAFTWLLMCNLVVAETALVILSDLGSHSHSDGHSDLDDSQDHWHHKTHHPGHSQEHKHSEDSDSHSHGKSTPTSFTSPGQFNAYSLIDISSFQPMTLLFYSGILTVWEPVWLKRAIGPPGESIASFLLSSLSISSNAPPVSLLA